jgi:hypothetical protein
MVNMTHNELLAEIDERATYLGNEDSVYQALRAVVELHKPEEQDHKQYEKCWNCNLLYPCPTIHAIEKELE